MAISLIIWGSVLYFSPQQGTEENNDVIDEISDLQPITWDVQIIDEILPEVNPDEPENTAAPILITEDGEIDEMDQTIEVQLENGETEVVRQWDLWDAIEISK